MTLAFVLVALVPGQVGTREAAASAPAAVVPTRAAATDTADRPRPTTAGIRAARPAVAAAQAPAQAPADVPATVPAQAAADAPATAPAQAAAATAPAPAAAPANLCEGEGWQQRRGEAALASLGPAAGRTGFSVQFSAARSGYLGLAHLDRRVIEVFVRPCGQQSDELLRHVVAHELGHAYDTTHLTAASRTAWQAARGIRASTPWYGCSGCADFATPAGDFAEVYAQWLRGASSNRSQLAGSPGPDALADLARTFFTA